jgi:hypothetical protein
MNSAKGRAVLLGLSGQTGGYEFEMTANRSVTAIYTAITDDLRNQYRLGLACDGENCKPGYHSLMLGTRTAGQTVQSRQGFFAGDQKFNLSTDVLPAWVAKNISGESAAPAEPGLVAARRLALGQREQPVSFVADESLECDGLGKGGTAICKGTAKVHFDWATRMVTRQAKLSAGTTLQMTGVTNFGEFGVEVSNIFRSLTLQQFQPAERGAPMPFGLREFDFMADSSSSAWQVWDGARWLTIPYVGAIWIDPADGSIVRLQRTSTRLPATMPVGLIQSEIEFSSATVGSESVLMLPARTRERICERGEDACLEISSVVNSYSPP